MNIRNIMDFRIFFLFIFVLLYDFTKGKLEASLSYSYLTFGSSLADNPSSVVFEGTKMYVLGKKCLILSYNSLRV